MEILFFEGSRGAQVMVGLRKKKKLETKRRQTIDKEANDEGHCNVPSIAGILHWKTIYSQNWAPGRNIIIQILTSRGLKIPSDQVSTSNIE